LLLFSPLPILFSIYLLRVPTPTLWPPPSEIDELLGGVTLPLLNPHSAGYLAFRVVSLYLLRYAFLPSSPIRCTKCELTYPLLLTFFISRSPPHPHSLLSSCPRRVTSFLTIFIVFFPFSLVGRYTSPPESPFFTKPLAVRLLPRRPPGPSFPGRGPSLFSCDRVAPLFWPSPSQSLSYRPPYSFHFCPSSPPPLQGVLPPHSSSFAPLSKCCRPLSLAMSFFHVLPMRARLSPHDLLPPGHCNSLQF